MSDFDSDSDTPDFESDYSGDGDEENYPSDDDSDRYMSDSSSGTEPMSDSDSDGGRLFGGSDSDGGSDPDSDSDSDGDDHIGLDGLFKSSGSIDLSKSADDDEEEMDDKPRKPKVGYREFICYAGVEEVVCMSCFELPRDPIALSCGHIICRECAKEGVDVFKATSFFTQRYKLKDEEVGEGDDVLMCPVCMNSVLVKGGIKECKTNEHVERAARFISEEKECLCGMCLSEFSAGVHCHVEKGIYECDRCGPLCERHCHCFVAGHEHGKHKQSDKNHMRLISYPLKLKRVYTNSKTFDLANGVSGRVIFSDRAEPCDIYCETCEKPMSRCEYYRKCAKNGHKTISLEEACKRARKQKEEAEAQHESLEKERKEAITKAVDAIEDKIADLSTKRLVAKSLLEDGLYTTNMSEAQAKIREFYDRVREACTKCEEELLGQLEEKEKEVKETLSRKCEAAEVLSANAEMLTKALKMNLEAIDSEEVLASLITRLSKMDAQITEASELDQKELDMKDFVTQKRDFTDEGLRLSIPSSLVVELSKSGKKERASAENYEDSEEESKKEEKETEKESEGELSIEEARKRIKERTTKDDLKKIDSSITFRSILGSSLSSLDSSSGKDMFCAALFEIITRLRPSFSMDMIPILTESFCSLHDWDDIKKYEKVSEVFVELQAIALMLQMEL